MANTIKKPSIKAKTSLFLRFKSECPITIGKRGNIHGEITERNPAENENNNPTSIIFLLENTYKF
jgi:hypothetical protein